MLNVLLVEDHYEDMEYCSSLLNQLNMKINLIKVGNGKKAMDMLLMNNVDVAFIDVQLPDISGFKLVEKIQQIPEYQFLKIVFITADSASQLQAYKKFHCYDYITKPFLPEEFNNVIIPLLTGLNRKDELGRVNHKKEVLFLESRNEKYVVDKEEILFAECNGRTVTIYLNDKVIQDIKMKLDDLILYVNRPYFVRCHKSFAVNLQKVEKITRRRTYIGDIVFENCDLDICYISRTYYKEIIAKLKEMGRCI